MKEIIEQWADFNNVTLKGIREVNDDFIVITLDELGIFFDAIKDLEHDLEYRCTGWKVFMIEKHINTSDLEIWLTWS